MSFKRSIRALVLGTVVVAMATAGLSVVPGVAGATEDTTVTRVAGDNRFETAAESATLAYPAGADTVVIANGLVFADALAAGGLAGSVDAPILLVVADQVPQATADAITELDPDNVIILGGTAAVSQAIEDGFVADGLTVTRIAGDTRFETAAEAATQTGAPDVGALKTAVLASGLGFADAVSISPGAHALGLPILLTIADQMIPATQAYIDDNGIEQIVILGGTSAVSQKVEDDLKAAGITVVRLAGANRFATSVEVAEFHLANGFTADSIFLATGLSFADALGGGPLASVTGGPLVLTPPASLGADAKAFMEANADDFDNLFVFGGEGAVSSATASEAAAAGKATQTGPTVSPDTLSVIETNGTSEANTPDDDRSFTVTSVDNAKKYRITLFDSANVDTNGSTVFADTSPDDDRADEGTVSARIIMVNGTPSAAAQTVGGITPAGGEITFVIDGDDPESLTPVVYEDPGTGPSTSLDLDADNEAIDVFALGGETTFIPTEAPDGAAVSGIVSSKGADASYATIGASSTVYFRTGDEYRINQSGPFCTVTTAADFLKNLSPGDELRTVEKLNTPTPAPYDQDGPNTFCLFDLAPVAPPMFLASAGDPADTTVELNWNNSPTVSVDSYNVYVSDEVCADTTADEFTLLGNVPAPVKPSAAEYVAKNLKPETKYRFVATSVDEDDESARADASDDITTKSKIEKPFLEVATLDVDVVPTGGASAGDIWVLQFNEAMSTPGTSATILLLDADGDEFQVKCSGNASVNTDTDATCNVIDGPDGDSVNDTIRVTLLEDAVDRNVGGGNDALEYPATITATSGIVDTDDAAEVDLAVSTDKIVG